jgi:hypothetical protein
MPGRECPTPDSVDAAMYLKGASFVDGETLHLDGEQSVRP